MSDTKHTVLKLAATVFLLLSFASCRHEDFDVSLVTKSLDGGMPAFEFEIMNRTRKTFYMDDMNISCRMIQVGRMIVMDKLSDYETDKGRVKITVSTPYDGKKPETVIPQGKSKLLLSVPLADEGQDWTYEMEDTEYDASRGVVLILVLYDKSKPNGLHGDELKEFADLHASVYAKSFCF